jgi:hypothetical protein
MAKVAYMRIQEMKERYERNKIKNREKYHEKKIQTPPNPKKYDIVKCHCGKNEYYSLMQERNGSKFCRRCISEFLKKDGFQGRVFKHFFPYDESGKRREK